jgi:hypothetical protein
MKFNTLIVIGCATVIVGCAEKEQAGPEPGSALDPAVSAETESPVAEPGVSTQAEDWRNAAFLDHMHAHAEHLDDLNFALDDDDLEQAMTPAYWLSRHNTVSGLPADLQPFVVRMREAARDVEEAGDLAAARAAAQRISRECQGCHSAVGVVTQ